MHPSQQSRVVRLAGPVGLSVLLVGGIVYFSGRGLGEGVEPAHGALSALWLILSQGLIAAAYLLGAFGWGRPLAARWAADSPSRMWLQLALGVGVMLSLSHLLGMLGLLSGDGVRPRIVGWGTVGIGLMLMLDQVVRGPLRPEKWPVLTPWAALWGPALALLLVSAANPPGNLWATEYGSYDEQSYHVQLPKEWAAGARLWPTQHNVYSFLPSLVESAYLHLGTMQPGSNLAVERLMGDEAAWIIGCHMLHALMAVVAALLIARAAWTLAIQAGLNGGGTGKSAQLLGVLAGALMLGTPWMIVTGSLGYTEAGMLAMMAGGMLAALDTTLRPGAGGRGIICGLLVGAACGCKPTAMLMVAPVVGILLLGNMPAKMWGRAVVGGGVAGVLMLAPWLVRNWLASGNPVFPFAARVFGTGHWTAEQIHTYVDNHGAEAGITPGGRIARLFSTQYGLLHDQWWIMLWLAGAALAIALLWRRTHIAAALLAAGLIAQALAWLAFTHLQSRFLLPMLPVFVLLIALAGTALLHWIGQRTNATGARGGRGLGILAACVLAIMPLSQAAWSARLFEGEGKGAPNLLLLGGAGRQTGLMLDEHFRSLTDAERAKFLAEDASPRAYVNLGLRPQEMQDTGVFLLGDGAPLYFAAAVGDADWGRDGRSKVVYHTTWDASPLGAAIRAHPDDPRAWTEAIGDLGVGYVLVNFDELLRLVVQSKYYDASVTPERVQRWLTDPSAGLKRVRAWPSGAVGAGAGAGEWSGQAIYKITLPVRPKAEGTAKPGEGANDTRP